MILPVVFTPERGATTMTDQSVIDAIRGGIMSYNHADSAESVNGMQEMKVVFGTSDGPVTIEYSYRTAYRPDGDGGTEEFDLF